MTEVERIVSRARRGRAIFVGVIASLCLGGVTYAIVVNFQQDTQLTRVERSACAQAPASAECQKVKRQSDRNRSIADTCIAFWKVGYPCPKPDARKPAAAAPARAFRGGDALQPAPASPPPAPAGAGGSTKPPRKGGRDDGADPSPPSSPDQPAAGEPAPQPSPSTPAATTTSEQASPPPAAAPASESEPAPGLLDPALSTVCSIADRIAHLCS